MLILTRKVGQGFTIGDDIEIMITDVSGDKVRVGIEAPKHIKVLRCELSQTMEENQSAVEKIDSNSLRALAQGFKAVPVKKEDAEIAVHKVQKKDKP